MKESMTKKFEGWSRNLTTYIDCLSYHSPGKTGLTQHDIIGSDLRPSSVLAWRRFTCVWRTISLQGSSCCCTVVAFLPALKDLLRTKQQSFSFVKSFFFSLLSRKFVLDRDNNDLGPIRTHQTRNNSLVLISQLKQQTEVCLLLDIP